MDGTLFLFEDRQVDRMRPVSLTRPAFGITCACYSLYEVARLVTDDVDHIVRDHLVSTTAKQFPGRPAPQGPALFVNASMAPDVRYVPILKNMLADADPFIAATEQRVIAALLPLDQAVPSDLSPERITDWLLDLDLPARDPGPLLTLDYPFHLIKHLEGLFPANVERRVAEGGFREVQPGVFVGDDVRIAETAVFHADDGPIVLDDGVRVLDFTYFTGPVYVGPGSRIIERSSVKEFTCTGHTCKIGGEVEAAIIEPYTNKQHSGFLGHAYVGSWVNMGAGTSNSDLKNTYGEIRFDYNGHRVQTGTQFLGCIVGDYVKTAVNTSIFTGKVIGVASILYGFVGQNVPCFCNYAKSFGQITECSLEQVLTTQRRMFARRNVPQTPDDVELLRAVHELTRHERTLSDEPPAF